MRRRYGAIRIDNNYNKQHNNTIKIWIWIKINK